MTNEAPVDPAFRTVSTHLVDSRARVICAVNDGRRQPHSDRPDDYGREGAAGMRDGSSETLRYLAIGDSLTEGIGDDVWPGGMPRGWADRLATRLNQSHTDVEYANLAVRGATTTSILDGQVDLALAMQPDIVSVTGGMNDMMRPRYDGGATADRIEQIVDRSVDAGAHVLLIPMPDMSGLIPIGRALAARVHALNAALVDCARRHRTAVVDIDNIDLFAHRALWSADRLHMNRHGHALLAELAAQALGRAEITRPAPHVDHTREGGDGLAAELAWWRTHALPWIGRRIAGKSSGDGRSGKMITLTAVDELATVGPIG